MYHRSGLLPEAVTKKGWSVALQEVANVTGAWRRVLGWSSSDLTGMFLPLHGSTWVHLLYCASSTVLLVKVCEALRRPTAWRRAGFQSCPELGAEQLLVTSLLSAFAISSCFAAKQMSQGHPISELFTITRYAGSLSQLWLIAQLLEQNWSAWVCGRWPTSYTVISTFCKPCLPLGAVSLEGMCL